MINSLPWRNNELLTLIKLYPLIENCFNRDQSLYEIKPNVNLSDVVKFLSTQKKRREYIRALYSLLVLEDTELLIFDEKERVVVKKSKLFSIESSSEDIQSLAEELKKSDSEISLAKSLLHILENFKIVFDNGALFEIEKLHRSLDTTKKNPNNNQEKKYLKYKHGHLFSCPHPYSGPNLFLLRLWALFSAFKPLEVPNCDSMLKSFNLDCFLAITGLANHFRHKPKIFQDHLTMIAQYFGAVKINKTAGTVQLSYGFCQALVNEALQFSNSPIHLKLRFESIASKTNPDRPTISSDIAIHFAKDHYKQTIQSARILGEKQTNRQQGAPVGKTETPIGKTADPIRQPLTSELARGTYNPAETTQKVAQGGKIVENIQQKQNVVAPSLLSLISPSLSPLTRLEQKPTQPSPSTTSRDTRSANKIELLKKQFKKFAHLNPTQDHSIQSFAEVMSHLYPEMAKHFENERN